MKKVIITGATGMVGKGVLLECLDDPRIEKILVINRSPIALEHQKLKEVLLKDFTQITTLREQVRDYDACFYCMGVSSVGMKEAPYDQITYAMTKAFVDTLYPLNPGMVFNYVSGTGTDATEKGNSMWARIKGKTENMVLTKGFRDAYAFRPGMIIPENGITSKTGWYNMIYIVMRPLFPILKRYTNSTTTTNMGKAMINTIFYSQKRKHLENRDINLLSGKTEIFNH